MRAVWWIAVALLGCGSGDDGDDGAPADTCPPFTRIVDGSFTRNTDNLTWTLEVEGIPADFVVDQTNVPTFVEEYLWAIEIDTDGDGMPNYEVSAKHFKADQAESVVTNILGTTQNAIWSIMGAAGSLTGFADITLAGNTFTFVVPVDEEAGLADVTEATGMVAKTYYHYGDFDDFCRDMSEL